MLSQCLIDAEIGIAPREPGHFSGNPTSDSLNGYQTAQITTELNWAIDHAKYYQCHVVALGRACGECVGCLHDPGNDASSGEAGATDDRLD
jgi:hypothetical protein